MCLHSGLEPRFYDLLPENNWEVDLGQVAKLRDERTVAILILTTAAALRLPIIADEVYEGIAFQEASPFIPLCAAAMQLALQHPPQPMQPPSHANHASNSAAAAGSNGVVGNGVHVQNGNGPAVGGGEATHEAAQNKESPIAAAATAASAAAATAAAAAAAAAAGSVPILTVSSLSKRFLVPGWRVGWIAVHDPRHILKNARVIESLERILQYAPQPCSLIQVRCEPPVPSCASESSFTGSIEKVRHLPPPSLLFSTPRRPPSSATLTFESTQKSPLCFFPLSSPQAALPAVLNTTPPSFLRDLTCQLADAARTSLSRVGAIPGLECPSEPQGGMFLMVCGWPVTIAIPGLECPSEPQRGMFLMHVWSGMRSCRPSLLPVIPGRHFMVQAAAARAEGGVDPRHCIPVARLGPAPSFPCAALVPLFLLRPLLLLDHRSAVREWIESPILASDLCSCPSFVFPSFSFIHPSPRLRSSTSFLFSSPSSQSSPFVAGVAVATAALAARYGIEAWQAFKARPAVPRIRRFYEGGFQPTMTRREAALILGIRESAAQEKVREAHRRVMTANHPDAGGSDLLASKINEAKDLLLGQTKGSGSAF
ncbi:unnamed protein product [Closterium sp. NIES-65]|nr:unnamed protein product [Closterium sp. NIES-65]